MSARLAILCLLVSVLQAAFVQSLGEHQLANRAQLTVEMVESCLRECRFVKALCVNDVDCYGFAFDVMHPQCARKGTNTSQLALNADNINQKNSPVDACLLLKTCLLLELKEIKEQQKEQQDKIKQTTTNSLSALASGPLKRITKPKLAPRKKRGHGGGKKLKKNKSN